MNPHGCRFMIVTSAQNGLHSKAWLRAPQYGLQNWFDGGTTILFTFGGHYMLMVCLPLFLSHGQICIPCSAFHDICHSVFTPTCGPMLALQPMPLTHASVQNKCLQHPKLHLTFSIIP